MNRVFVIVLIPSVGLFSVNCRSVYLEEKEAERQLYKYNSTSVFVVEKAAGIQKRIPPPSFNRCGSGPLSFQEKRWNEFVNKQHDDLTVDALLYLYKTSSDEKIRRRALQALSHQKKERLILLWQEILEHPENINEVYTWSAISGLATINVSQSNQILISLYLDPETPPEISTKIYNLFREKGVLHVKNR